MVARARTSLTSPARRRARRRAAGRLAGAFCASCAFCGRPAAVSSADAAPRHAPQPPRARPAGPTPTRPAPSVVGSWLAADGSAAYDVVACADTAGRAPAGDARATPSVCARLTWARDGAARPDAANRVRHLRARPLCGVPVFYGARADGRGAWTDGVAYDVATGRSRNAELRPVDDSTLALRVMVGLEWRAATWRRGAPPARCGTR